MQESLKQKLEELGDKNRKVIEHFLEHGRKKAAYLSYYHKAPASEITRFFKLKHIQDIIREAKQGAADKTAEILEKKSYDKAWLQERLAKLCDFNIFNFLSYEMDDTGVVRMYYDFTNATEDDWYCISELTMQKVVRGADQDIYPVEQVKIKGVSKEKALELMGKSMGAFTDKVELDEKVTVIFDREYDYKD